MSRLLLEIDTSIKKLSIVHEGLITYGFVAGVSAILAISVTSWIQDVISDISSSLNFLHISLNNVASDIITDQAIASDIITDQAIALDSATLDIERDQDAGLSTLLLAIIPLTALLSLTIIKKNKIIKFENDLLSTRQLLIHSGFQVNYIYDSAKKLQIQQIQNCKQPESKILDILVSQFTIKLNCTLSAIVEYSIYILTQLFILYFDSVKKQNPNVRIFNYIQILDYDILSGKIFKQQLVDLNLQLLEVLNIIYKDAGVVKTIIDRLNKAIGNGSFK